MFETTVFPCGFLFAQLKHFFSSFSIGYLLSSASARGDNLFMGASFDKKSEFG